MVLGSGSYGRRVLGFWVQGLWVLGFRGLGFRVLGFRVCQSFELLGMYKVLMRVWGSCQGTWFKLPSLQCTGKAVPFL